jgi:hypothetical protein
MENKRRESDSAISNANINTHTDIPAPDEENNTAATDKISGLVEDIMDNIEDTLDADIDDKKS